MESMNKKLVMGLSIIVSMSAIYFVGSSYFSMKSQLVFDQGYMQKQEREEFITKIADEVKSELQEIKKIINSMLQHQVQNINREIVQSRNNVQQRPQEKPAQQAEPARKSHGNVTEIATKDDLQNLLDNNNNPSVLFFHMNGCGWCRKMDPVFDEVAQNPNFSKIKFYRIEGRACQAGELVQKAFDQKITGFPTLLFVNQGKFVDKQVGFAKQEDLESKIKQYLNN